jgi:hypothetical protein
VRYALGRILGLLLASAAASPALAQGGGAPPTVAGQTLNPLADSIQLYVTPSLGSGGTDAGSPWTVNVRSRVPFGLTKAWRVVTRSNVSVSHVAGTEDATGLEDSDVSFFLTPARASLWAWGAGAVLQLPTATDMARGTGKWSVGPTAALVYLKDPPVHGVLVNHLWSFAGPGSREDVNVTQVEVQLSQTFSDHWYIASAPTISRDWRAPAGQAWTVPFGADVGRTLTLGSADLTVQAGAYYNVVKPEGADRWVFGAELSALAPSFRGREGR